MKIGSQVFDANLVFVSAVPEKSLATHAYMPYRCAFIVLFLLTTHALAIDDPVANLKRGKPEDVRNLIDRMSDCNHWSGEEAYDAGRKREILRAVKRLKCDRLENDEVVVRKRYARQPDVLQAIQKAKE